MADSGERNIVTVNISIWCRSMDFEMIPGIFHTKNGKIKKIAHKISPEKDTQILNAEGLHIYPGFIDAHSHIGIAEEQTTAKTDLSNEGTNPVTPFIRAIDGVNPMDSAFHNAWRQGSPK